jgi:hypothetical protein
MEIDSHPRQTRRLSEPFASHVKQLVKDVPTGWNSAFDEFFMRSHSKKNRFVKINRDFEPSLKMRGRHSPKINMFFRFNREIGDGVSKTMVPM